MMVPLVFLALLAQAPAETLQARGERISAKVEEILGLKFGAPVKLREGTSKERAATSLEGVKLLYGEDLSVGERALKGLGLIPRLLRLDLTITLLAQGGKPYQRQDAVALTDTSVGDDELVFRFASALVDQRFHLAETAKKTGPSFDAQMALAAVRQGTGDMAKQLFWASKKLDEKLPDDHVEKLVAGAEKWEKESSRFASFAVPRLFVRGSDFGWRRGGIFMESVRRKDGIAAVHKVFERLPASTEQILHPDKYAQDERPVAIDPKSVDDFLAAKGYKRVWSTTLGELGTSILLETHVKDDTSKAGPGWGGDLLAYYEDASKRRLVVWATAWDTENDANEFLAAGCKLGQAMSADDEARNTALRRGTSVGVLLNVPANLQDEAFNALWKCTRRSGDRTEPYGQE